MSEAQSGHIVLAAYHPDQKMLERQLQTLMKQTLSDWSCEIGIDGTDPDARDRITALVAHDDRFSVSMFEERRGFYRNFERLLERVPRNVAWVALADQDDDWFPEKLARLVPRLEQSSLVFGQAYVVENGNESGRPPLAERHVGSLAATMIDNQVTGSLSVLRRKLLDVALPFPAATDVAFHDHWLGICALVSDGVTSYPDAVQNYIQHSANVIGEEKDLGLVARVGTLGSLAGRSLAQKLNYLSVHRWGWRVGIAKSILQQASALRPHDRWLLERYALNRLSIAYLCSTVGCIMRRDVPMLRAFALILGAAHAPRVKVPRAQG